MALRGGGEEQFDQILDRITELAERRKVNEVAWERFCERIGVLPAHAGETLGYVLHSTDDPIETSLSALIGKVEIDEGDAEREAELLRGLFAE